MQFIPSTWQVVKVDADGDGQRNPQDINDASLGDGGLPLLRHRQPRSPARASRPRSSATTTASATSNLVLRLMEAYISGDYTAVPSGTYGGRLLLRHSAPDRSRAPAPARATTAATARHHRPGGQARPATAPRPVGPERPGATGTGRRAAPVDARSRARPAAHDRSCRIPAADHAAAPASPTSVAVRRADEGAGRRAVPGRGPASTTRSTRTTRSTAASTTSPTEIRPVATGVDCPMAQLPVSGSRMADVPVAPARIARLRQPRRRDQERVSE